ncbi:CPA_1a_G0031210.mRNA.1.CDS.1 [Saccharomyces cerevisiae]|nr:CPI_1c_G0030470.mRNA.1.CDS.1 [Saccharomyces cerevisiae]CAI4559852.1 CPA_1a_G0031210.mRNA.1.CDS.1 [Saccharomyces cerevisiae]CAI4571449.1 BBM_1a_G0030680.mRNA.1.CDS.1 [Saccharomyces cerevisiae]CAI7186144.1 BBM_1a_G0030680.mRNA.1.CDS.1 [Saccharomyces cerevisiae]CAI7366951.1 CPI_1c_G0030470.mRNA.1.CDS.1 [Saccharomyces cerevisiae]
MSLEDTLANMSLYDAKKYFRKAQNVVFNYTEMEGKVREATNNEPWGASSTLMDQISQGTYNFREREEILSMIFRRFTEKAGSEWRQIYKALQLLDYLIKHGSERFIDDTRNSINLIRILETFHYIDSQGRDQGINVRTRVKALIELLSDDNKIRAERKRARETAKKYKGVAGGSASADGSLNSKAGFTSTKVHGISVSADFDSDNEDNEDGSFRGNGYNDNSSRATSAPQQGKQEPEDFVDFFSNDSSQPSKELIQENDNNANEEEDDDDEFSEFQSAVPVTNPANSFDLLNTNPIGVVPATTSSMSFYNSSTTNQSKITPAIAEPKKVDPFSSLFSTAKASSEAHSTPKASQANAPASNPVSNSTTALSTDQDDDDDEFGEMHGGAVQQEPNTTNNDKSSKEVDLLSF